MPIKDLRVNLSPKMDDAEVFARRSVLSRTLEGLWITIFKGKGMEFAGYRAYQYGDDASMIDWRASLRSSQTLVREFEEYKSFKVFLMVDVSNSMLFSTTEKLKCEYAAELAYVLADAILKAGDAVGMCMFSDSLKGKIFPDIGSGILEKMKQELLKNDNYGGKSDFKHVVKETVPFLNSNAVVIIISDFLNMPDKWEHYIRMMGEHFQILGIVVRDSRDRVLPKNSGQYSLFDPDDDKEGLFIDPETLAEKYNSEMKKDEIKIRRVFESVKGGSVIISTNKDFVDPLISFFMKRRFVAATL